MKMKKYMSMFCPDACKNHANFVGTVLANARSMPGFKANVLPGTGQKFDIKNKKNPLQNAAGKGGGRRPLWLAQLVCKTAAGEIALWKVFGSRPEQIP